jgi:pyridoxal phosphate enzyme (YggS family)
MIDPVAALRDITSRIELAARGAGRDPSAVTLVAVSKTYGEDALLPVLAADQRVFGENRVQEAKAKWPPLKARFEGVELHLLGPLQSNKTKEAVELFDAIHSVDRMKIAEALAAEMTKQGRRLKLFVQVNTGEEPQKAGISPCETAAFVACCREQLRLDVAGLMCIPPVDEEPALHFALLAKLSRENNLDGLSMGMSHDFETAIALGATHVRVGSAIFGARG